MDDEVFMLLQNELSKKDEILFGYLFGSYATNQQTKKSDIDLALYLQNVDLDTRLQISYELSKFLKKDVDIVVLNDIKNVYLLENILKDGIIIKDHEKRIDFEVIKYHDILDYKAFRKYIDAA